MKELTLEEQTANISRLEELKGSVGWKLIAEVLEENIEHFSKELLIGVNGETLEDVRVKRKQLNGLKKLLNAPDNMIKMWTPQEAHEEDNPDPYHKKRDYLLV